MSRHLLESVEVLPGEKICRRVGWARMVNLLDNDHVFMCFFFFIILMFYVFSEFCPQAQLWNWSRGFEQFNGTEECSSHRHRFSASWGLLRPKEGKWQTCTCLKSTTQVRPCLHIWIHKVRLGESHLPHHLHHRHHQPPVLCHHQDHHHLPHHLPHLLKNNTTTSLANLHTGLFWHYMLDILSFMLYLFSQDDILTKYCIN